MLIGTQTRTSWHSSFRQLNMHNINNRRDLLRFTASIFDPLGILSPASWDSCRSSELKQEIKKWLVDASTFDGLVLDRYRLCPNLSSTKLVGFCDVSCDAYAAAVYIVSLDQDESLH